MPENENLLEAGKKDGEKAKKAYKESAAGIKEAVGK